MGLLNHFRGREFGACHRVFDGLTRHLPQPVYRVVTTGEPRAALINRIVDYLSFFTIWSNIVVAIVAGHFVYRPRAASPWFRTLWLSALLMISVTGLIYHFALADLVDTKGQPRSATRAITY